MSAFIPISGSGGGGGVQSIVQGANIVVDNTDPANPIINLASPIVIAGTSVPIIQGSTVGANLLLLDANGQIFMQESTATGSFGFDGAKVKVTGANVSGNTTVSPVTSITIDDGFPSSIS